MAECATEATVCALFLDSASDRTCAATRRAHAAMAKCGGSDRACRVIDECVQLHGGYGYNERVPDRSRLGRHPGQRIYGGTNEI